MPRRKELRRHLPPQLIGFFWYSRRQRKELDAKGHDRMFCQLWKDKSIREYTELVEKSTLEDDPNDRCFYEDAVALGWGHIHSLIPCGEQELKVEI